jgi:hypothetical protein
MISTAMARQRPLPGARIIVSSTATAHNVASAATSVRVTAVDQHSATAAIPVAFRRKKSIVCAAQQSFQNGGHEIPEDTASKIKQQLKERLANNVQHRMVNRERRQWIEDVQEQDITVDDKKQLTNPDKQQAKKDKEVTNQQPVSDKEKGNCEERPVSNNNQQAHKYKMSGQTINEPQKNRIELKKGGNEEEVNNNEKGGGKYEHKTDRNEQNGEIYQSATVNGFEHKANGLTIDQDPLLDKSRNQNVDWSIEKFMNHWEPINSSKQDCQQEGNHLKNRLSLVQNNQQVHTTCKSTINGNVDNLFAKCDISGELPHMNTMNGMEHNTVACDEAHVAPLNAEDLVNNVRKCAEALPIILENTVFREDKLPEQLPEKINEEKLLTIDNVADCRKKLSNHSNGLCCQVMPKENGQDLEEHQEHDNLYTEKGQSLRTEKREQIAEGVEQQKFHFHHLGKIQEKSENCGTKIQDRILYHCWENQPRVPTLTSSPDDLTENSGKQNDTQVGQNMPVPVRRQQTGEEPGKCDLAGLCTRYQSDDTLVTPHVGMTAARAAAGAVAGTVAGTVAGAVAGAAAGTVAGAAAGAAAGTVAGAAARATAGTAVRAAAGTVAGAVAGAAVAAAQAGGTAGAVAVAALATAAHERAAAGTVASAAAGVTADPLAAAAARSLAGLMPQLAQRSPHRKIFLIRQVLSGTSSQQLSSGQNNEHILCFENNNNTARNYNNSSESKENSRFLANNIFDRGVTRLNGAAAQESHRSDLHAHLKAGIESNSNGNLLQSYQYNPPSSSLSRLDGTLDSQIHSQPQTSPRPATESPSQFNLESTLQSGAVVIPSSNPGTPPQSYIQCKKQMNLLPCFQSTQPSTVQPKSWRFRHRQEHSYTGRTGRRLLTIQEDC